MYQRTYGNGRESENAWSPLKESQRFHYTPDTIHLRAKRLVSHAEIFLIPS